MLRRLLSTRPAAQGEDIVDSPLQGSRRSPPNTPKGDALANWVRDEYGAFIAEHVNPKARERDLAGVSIPKEVIRRAGELGLLSLSLPHQLGGAAVSIAVWGRILEELGFLCADFSFLLMLGTRIGVAKAIYDTGHSELITKYAIPMANGQCEGCFSYSDGGDAFALNTRVTRTGGGWIINGSKYMVTGAMTGDVFMTYGRDDNDDVVALLVERDTPGLKISTIPSMGARAAGLGCVEYRDVFVPESNVLTCVDGVSHSQGFLGRRATLLAAPLGMARRLLLQCIDALGQRRRFGKPLTDMESVQAALGRMRVAIEASRWVLSTAFERMDDPSSSAALTSSIAKYFVSEKIQEVARTAQYLLGGEGYASTADFERYTRDFAAFIAGAGTQYTLEVNVGVLSLCHQHNKWS
jgi:acyl-CoA dehydrogenase